MRRVLSVGFAAVLATGMATPDARADWGSFYLGSAPSAPRKPAAALPDRTGMHAQTQRHTLPRANAMETDVTPMESDVPSPATGDPSGHCVAEILRAQARYGIPDNILLGIGLQEAGVSRGGRLTVWPWAVNAAGVGRIFDGRAAAMDWVRERESKGVRSIDVGCMQINLRWHPEAFATLEQGFDPAVNVDYSARFLHSLYSETGDWMRAAGAYHSRTPARAEVYLASLRRNVAVANDRIDGFHAIAGAASPETMRPVTVRASAPAYDHPQPSQSGPPARWDYGYWSTNGGDSGGVYGIYSREQLEPVLPQFLQDF